MTITPKLKRRLKNIVKRALAYCIDPLAERQYYRDCFDKYSENGHIAIVRKGHDCDHMYYYRVTIIPTPRSAFAFEHWENNHREYLDGPEAMWIDPPSKHDNEDHAEYHDLAAERMGY